ncbi:hypothetical protein FBQ97_05475 [Acidobacteria bacterium ACD]|nr:MAG: hypothetical protein EDX89_18250 [Acidobacteriota bacterium]MCE7956697.1 hypothetical protein [Acidobacteria bacterium ACB2]MDL1949250.1 hypothetical protein [Acidobacteria bacterium ACD]
MRDSAGRPGRRRRADREPDRRALAPPPFSFPALAAAAEAERRWLIEAFASLGAEPLRVEHLVSRRASRRLSGPRWGERRRYPRSAPGPASVGPPRW